MKRTILFAIFPAIVCLAGCSQESPKQYFQSWKRTDKSTGSLDVLINYVNDVTNPNSKNFIPVEDRIATFDMDGTFIGELYPTYFEYNLLEYRALEDPNFKDICPIEVKEVAQEIRDFVRKGTKLPDHFDMRHAYAAAKAYAGMSVAEFDRYVKDYAKNTPNGFTGMTYATSFYKPMLEVFDYLKDHNFDYYVVSGSDRYICRSITESIGIPSNKIIGMDVVTKASGQGYQDGVDYTMKSDEYLIRTDELIIKNLKTNKVKQISQEIGKIPVLSFGNSSGDEAMHNYCKSNPKYKTEVFMVVADNDRQDHIDPEETARRIAKWKANDYNIFSMNDDFKTIYGENVQKVDFSWSTTTVNELADYDAFISETSKAPSKNYTKAILDIYNDTDEHFTSKPTESIHEHHQYQATYNSETGLWSISDDPLIDAYSIYLNNKAKDLTQDHVIYNEQMFQSRDIHYYTTAHGYRYRYKASGTTTSPIESTNAAMGVDLFNQYGYYIYHEYNLSMVFEGGNNAIASSETIFISYIAE